LGAYDEYLGRSNWGPSEALHNWMARRILTDFIRMGRFSPEATNILEIGAGTGRAGVQARGLGFRSYTGVEPTQALAEFCRAERGLSIVEESLPNLRGLSSSSFDAVFSMHVLEHAPGYGDAWLWCQEMARVVRPGGCILVAAPDIRDYRAYFWDVDWSHGYPTTPQRVSQIMRDLGLTIQYEGNMHLGRLGGFSAATAHVASALIPTRLGDLASRRIFGRPLASGLKFAVLWGLVFVVAQRPLELDPV